MDPVDEDEEGLGIKPVGPSAPGTIDCPGGHVMLWTDFAKGSYVEGWACKECHACC